MPRRPRLDLPDIPQHIIQRGNDRQPCFFAEVDRLRFLDVRFLNDRYRRTGTLWEGRYKSCLVDSETYLLRRHRYIELNPVRAGMEALPSN
jgi:putative transposase